MSDKVLVTYASRSGSTAGVAQAIADTLTEQGIAVDVYPMQAVQEISSYSAVIAGSPVQREKWLPEAMQFIEEHQDELSQKPFAVFQVCMALAVNNEQRREEAKDTASTWLEPVRQLVHPASEGIFAGVLDLSKIKSLPFQLLAQFGILIGFWSEGDYRDWDAIRQWTNSLVENLLPESEIREYA